MDFEKAKSIFENLFGNTDEKLGFSLTLKKTKNGFLITKWYERSSWSEPTLEKKVLLCNGIVFENNIKIATYD